MYQAIIHKKSLSAYTYGHGHARQSWNVALFYEHINLIFMHLENIAANCMCLNIHTSYYTYIEHI